MEDERREQLRRVFSKTWLTSGRAGDMVRDENIQLDDVQEEIKRFVNGTLGRLIEAAFDDFNDFIQVQGSDKFEIIEEL